MVAMNARAVIVRLVEAILVIMVSQDYALEPERDLQAHLSRYLARTKRDRGNIGSAGFEVPGR